MALRLRSFSECDVRPISEDIDCVALQVDHIAVVIKRTFAELAPVEVLEVDCGVMELCRTRLAAPAPRCVWSEDSDEETASVVDLDSEISDTEDSEAASSPRHAAEQRGEADTSSSPTSDPAKSMPFGQSAVPPGVFHAEPRCMEIDSADRTASPSPAPGAHPAEEDSCACVSAEQQALSEEAWADLFPEPLRTTIAVQITSAECTVASLSQVLNSRGLQGCYDFVCLCPERDLAIVNLVTEEGARYAMRWLAEGEGAAEVSWHEAEQGTEALERQCEERYGGAAESLRPRRFDRLGVPLPRPEEAPMAPPGQW